MDKKELGSKIKYARSLYYQQAGKKLTQQLLAEKVGISRSYMGDIESGRTYPTLVVLDAIARACNVSLDFFGNDEEQIRQFLKDTAADGKNENAELLRIPVLGVISAGNPLLAEQNIIGYEYLPQDVAKTGEYFGLRVSGDSMNNSRIHNGDIVLVRKQEDIENGEIAVVLVDGENATVKRFFRAGAMVTLMPDSSNKDHLPRFIDTTKNEVKILGKVVKVIINL